MKAYSVEDILLTEIKTVDKAVNDKNNPSPVLKHVRCITQKATKKMFKPVAYIKYDEAICERANGKGIEQFGIIETDEVYFHFSLENTVNVSQKSQSKAKGGRGTSKTTGRISRFS